MRKLFSFFKKKKQPNPYENILHFPMIHAVLSSSKPRIENAFVFWVESDNQRKVHLEIFKNYKAEYFSIEQLQQLEKMSVEAENYDCAKICLEKIKELKKIK